MRRTGLKKNLSSLTLEEKRKIIEPAHEKLSITKQCEIIGVKRSSYYAEPKGFSSDDYTIMHKIDEVFTEHPYFGTRRMLKTLQELGFDIGRKKVRKYYRIMGIDAIYPKMNLSKRNQAHKVYPYLLRNYKITGPNKVYSTDITYIRLKHGFVYLVAVIDWYSRYILSWKISISLDTEFCVEALNEAITTHGNPEIFNTDQGVQFTSRKFIEVLELHKIAISMDGKGRALDNVFIERFWRSLKQEKIYRIDLESVKEAIEAINEYMEFYNKRRIHQSLDYKTPAAIHFTSKEGASLPAPAASPLTLARILVEQKSMLADIVAL